MNAGKKQDILARENVTLPPVLGKIPWRKRVTTRIFFWFFLLLSLGFLGLGFQVQYMVSARDEQELEQELKARDITFIRTFSLLMKHQDLVGARDLLTTPDSSREKAGIILLKPDGYTPAFRDISTIIEMRNRGILLPTLGQARRITLSSLQRNLLNDPAFRKTYQAMTESPVPDSGISFRTAPPEGKGILSYLRPVPSGDSCRSCHNPQQAILGYAVAYQETGAFTRSLHKFGMKMFWAFLGTLELLVLLLVWTIRGKLVTPLVSVSGTVDRMSSGEGNLKTRLDVHRDDEIGQLATFINRFIDLFQGWVGEISDKVGWIGTQADILSREGEQEQKGTDEHLERLLEIHRRLDGILPEKALESGNRASKDSLPDLVERSIILEKGLSETLKVLSRKQTGPLSSLEETESVRIRELLRALESVLVTLETRVNQEVSSLSTLRNELREIETLESAQKTRQTLDVRRLREILEVARELERELRRFQA